MTEVLAISHLSVDYGHAAALRDISLTVAAGEAVALVGANGAGKSTLIDTVIGFNSSISGEIRFLGASLKGLPPEARARAGIGYCPEGRRIFPGLTVLENLEVASFAPAAETRRRLDGVFSAFPALAACRGSLGWQLSGGQQQMLAIGRALMGGPRLLLLDEPSLGLSPRLTDDLLRRIRDIANGGTAILLAEQNVAKALAVVDRAYVLQLGRLALAGQAAEMLENPLVRSAFLGG
jgi:branched-chain amino acid transport system ATP-binding protein